MNVCIFYKLGRVYKSYYIRFWNEMWLIYIILIMSNTIFSIVKIEGSLCLYIVLKKTSMREKSTVG